MCLLRWLNQRLKSADLTRCPDEYRNAPARVEARVRRGLVKAIGDIGSDAESSDEDSDAAGGMFKVKQKSKAELKW